jgi:erythromycin esterase-like protein
MSSSDVLIWLAMTTVAVTVVAQLWRSLHRAAERRARKRRYLLAGYESRPQQLRPDSEPAAGIGREEARAVRRHAEEAAALVAVGAGAPANPYPRGTPEYVLWIATYHLRLTELAEEQEERGTVRVTKAPGDPSLSGP